MELHSVRNRNANHAVGRLRFYQSQKPWRSLRVDAAQEVVVANGHQFDSTDLPALDRQNL